MASSFDALFGPGVELGGDLLVKAQLRVKVRRSRFPVVQSLVDQISKTYEQRLEAMLVDVRNELNAPQLRKASLVLSLDGRQVLRKAEPTSSSQRYTAAGQSVRSRGEGAASEYKRPPGGVKEPGARGGKWWRDEKGRVQYGERPSGRFVKPAEPEHVVAHYKQFSSSVAFLGPGDSAVHDAIVESEVIDPIDAEFMEFWQSSFDTFLEGFVKADGKAWTRKEIREDYNDDLESMPWHLVDETGAARRVSYGEAVEAFFNINIRDIIVEAAQEDPEEWGWGVEPPTEEDVIEAFHELLGKYDQALEDPDVQAAVMAAVEAREKRKNAFFLRAEQETETYGPLASVVTTGGAAAVNLQTAVAVNSLGLVGFAKKGGVARGDWKGMIVPSREMLSTEKAIGIGTLFQDPEQLDRLSTSHLMALYVGERLQDSISERGIYGVVPNRDGFHNDYSRDLFERTAKQLGVATREQRLQLYHALERAAGGASELFNGHNAGTNVYIGEVLQEQKAADVIGNQEAVDKFNDELAERARFVEQALEEQKNDTWAEDGLPAGMVGGVWEAWARDLSGEEALEAGLGHCLRDKDDLSQGVWSPFRHQLQYINWMRHVKRGVVAADSGTGKTPNIIAFRETMAAEGNDQRAICFLPPSLMEQWPQEVHRFAPGVKEDEILNLSGLSLEERKHALQSDMAKKAKYVFISTGTITGEKGNIEEDDGTGGTDSELAQLLSDMDGMVFIDEAHQGGYKKKQNTRHQLAKKIIGDREFAFGLTATPVPNDPIDLFHITNLFAPGRIGSEDIWEGHLHGVDFDEEQERWRVSEPRHIAELNSRAKPYVFYKKISDPDVVEGMGAALPSIHTDETEGDLSIARKTNAATGLKQEDYYKKGGVIDTMVQIKLEEIAKKALEERGKAIGSSALALIAGSMRVHLQRMVSISPALIDPSYKRKDGGYAHSPKITALTKDVVSHFKNGGDGGKDAKPIVVFCSYPNKAYGLVRQALGEAGVDPSRVETISGAVSPTERGYLQDKINANRTKVLLVGTLSGGAGLNLQKAANKMLFLDEPWSPAAKRQAIGRVWRTGQLSDVFVKTYRTSNTFDDVVEMRLGGKAVMASALLGDPPTAATFAEATEQSVKEVLGRQRGYEWSEDQIKKIMENAANYDMDSKDHVESQNLCEELWEQGVRDAKGLVMKEGFDQPSLEATAELRKVAPALASEFDESDFRQKWKFERDRRNASRDYNAAQVMHSVHTAQGDEAQAEGYARKRSRILRKFPHVDEKTAAEKKKPVKKEWKPPSAKKKEKEKEKKAVAKKKLVVRKKKKPAAKKVKGKAGEAEKGRAPKKAAATKEKLIKRTHGSGLQFYALRHKFDKDSVKEIGRSGIAHYEAAQVFNDLKNSKHKSWDEFIEGEIRLHWEGRFSKKKARDYLQKLVDLYIKHGLVAAGHKVK